MRARVRRGNVVQRGVSEPGGKPARGPIRIAGGTGGFAGHVGVELRGNCHLISPLPFRSADRSEGDVPSPTRPHSYSRSRHRGDELVAPTCHGRDVAAAVPAVAQRVSQGGDLDFEIAFFNEVLGRTAGHQFAFAASSPARSTNATRGSSAWLPRRISWSPSLRRRWFGRTWKGLNDIAGRAKAVALSSAILPLASPGADKERGSGVALHRLDRRGDCRAGAEGVDDLATSPD